LRRKLLFLNLALSALLAGSVWRLWRNWQDARAREQAVLGQSVRPVAPPAVAVSPPPQQVQAADYIDVAQKMLFAPDRNPEVVLEAAPAKPMPPLPVAHGVLDLGSGPTAILTEKPGADQRGFRVGEKVGDFKLVAVNARELTFEWEGQQIRKKLEELVAKKTKETGEARSSAPSPAPPKPTPTTSVLGNSSSQPAGPGVEVGGQMRACQPGDNSPPGTVVDGLRKVVTKTPFGSACRWEPVK
jgi:hypothetical protein